jgi:periplasmic protein TonB
VAGPLSFTIASVKRPSWKGRALGLCASLGLQTGALVALGVAPLVSFDGLPEPQMSETVRMVPVIEASVVPPAAPSKRSRVRSNAPRPHIPSGIVVPTRFSDEIPIEEALEDADDDFGEGVIGGVPYASVGAPDEGWKPSPVDPPAPTEPVTVGGDITPPRKRIHVSPVYPRVALQAHVQGTVVLEAIIDRDGNVANLRVLQSIPLLDGAALEAVRQWKYDPTYLNGRAVPVVMSVNVEFQMTR